MKAMMIVGLGNLEEQYERTYHNVGMLAVKHIARHLTGATESPVFKAHKGLFEYMVKDHVALVLPLTFMNDSGAAVKEAMKKFGGGDGKNLVVIHDESDLVTGTYQISSGKNSAGHKGVQSIMDALGGAKDFVRVRVGIRDKNEKVRKKASDFVLKTIKSDDMKTLEGVFEEITRELFA